MKDKTVLYLILGISIVVVAVVIYGLTAKTTTVDSQGQTVTTHGGLGELLGSFGSGGLGGFLGGLFGSKPKPIVNCVNNCDKNKLGYDCNGFPSSDCGFGG